MISLTTDRIFNLTYALPRETIPLSYGFTAIFVTAFGFGINLLPVKKFETGDGQFFQWVFSNAVLVGSYIVNAYLNFPKFEPLVMLGGFLWVTGNIWIVPIINSIGLGLGLLLCNSVNIIIGWASARFGWFGIFPQIPNNLTLNYVGFMFVAISPLIYSMVRTEVSREIEINVEETLKTDLLSVGSPAIGEKNFESNSIKFTCMKIKIGVKKRQTRILAIFMCLFAGFLYGLSFIPVTYVKNRYPGASQRDIDHSFAQCTGIYLGSSIYFFIYCIIKRNQPILHPKCILPAVASGFIWIIAYMAYFIANEVLSPAISQPIVSSLPGLISTIITTIVFKEIKGTKNYLLISMAILITGTGVTLTGLSKIL